MNITISLYCNWVQNIIMSLARLGPVPFTWLCHIVVLSPTQKGRWRLKKYMENVVMATSPSFKPIFEKKRYQTTNEKKMSHITIARWGRLLWIGCAFFIKAIHRYYCSQQNVNDNWHGIDIIIEKHVAQRTFFPASSWKSFLLIVWLIRSFGECGCACKAKQALDVLKVV